MKKTLPVLRNGTSGTRMGWLLVLTWSNTPRRDTGSIQHVNFGPKLVQPLVQQPHEKILNTSPSTTLPTTVRVSLQEHLGLGLWGNRPEAPTMSMKCGFVGGGSFPGSAQGASAQASRTLEVSRRNTPAKAEVLSAQARQSNSHPTLCRRCLNGNHNGVQANGRVPGWQCGIIMHVTPCLF